MAPPFFNDPSDIVWIVKSGKGGSRQKRRQMRKNLAFWGDHAADPVQGARVGWMLHRASDDLLLAHL
ncbi:MAG: hypothetical protein AAGH74_16370 [Pseudomonadota bacterium]